MKILHIAMIAVVTGLALLVSGCSTTTKKKVIKMIGDGLEMVRVNEPSARVKNPVKIIEHKLVTSSLRTAYFDENDEHPRKDSLANLDKNVKDMLGDGSIAVLIEAHADLKGDPNYNLGLSLKRATAVAEVYMMFGIYPGSIWVTTFGSTQPICRENTDECHAKNRRVETELLKEIVTTP